MFLKKRRRGSKPIVYGVIGNGQSLSVGDRAGSPLYSPYFTGPVAGSYMLTDIANGFTSPVSDWILTDIQEPMRGSGYGSIYPFNVSYQSPHTPMAQYLNLSFGINSAHTCAGESGQPYSVIKKGGTGNSYASSIAEVQRFKNLFDALGMKYEVLCVIWTHGESDYGDTSYSNYLIEVQNDYETDIKAITGQTKSVPLVITQPSAGFPVPAGEFTNIPDEMLEAYLAHPDKIILAGSKTGLDYVPGDYHLSAVGTTFLGFMYAMSVRHLITSAATFTPLYATNVSLNSSGDNPIITVTFNRNVVEDDSLYSGMHTVEHTSWLNGKGFEVIDSGNSELSILSTVISGSTATITVDTGTPYRVSYALYGDGSGTIRRGCIRDDDPDNYNWLCQFSHYF
jgi:hypothetical protein